MIGINVNINSYCDLDCPYCFGKEYMRSSAHRLARSEMTFNGFRKAVDFLRRARVNICNIGGGEPTLHPRFIQFAAYALSQGCFPVQVYTNGLFSERVRGALTDIKDKRRLFFLWNINHPKSYSKDNWRRLNENLSVIAALGTSSFGVNLYKRRQDLDYVYELADRYSPLQLRLCVAHPSGPGARNRFVATGESPAVIKDAMKLIRGLRRRGMRVIFDCGIVPCLLSDKDLGFLTRHGVHLGACRNLAVIGPDLSVFNCFQNDSVTDRRTLGDFSSLQEIEKHLSEIRSRFDMVFLFKECLRCPMSCDLGCLAERKMIAADYAGSLRRTLKRKGADPGAGPAIGMFHSGQEKEAGAYIYGSSSRGIKAGR
ncbi:MAG: hypothetical protein PHR44_01580 [Candidatus Omnitrophica bacterium]|nr:hypothetical protein [Candidatus Omnitrophota bacterium]